VSAATGRASLVEIVSTVLLAFAAVATAWRSYQGDPPERRAGEDVHEGHPATRIDASTAAERANFETEVDVTVFTQWIDAYAAGDTRLNAEADALFRQGAGKHPARVELRARGRVVLGVPLLRRGEHDLTAPRLRALTLVVGCAVFLGTLGWVASFPVSISV